MATKKKKILIVEDDSFTLKLYTSRLTDDGYDVVSTPDATEVLDLAKQHKPDACIVDIMFPAGNGFNVIESLRKQAAFKKTPIIVLSNLGHDKDIEEAKTSGANEYLVKSNTTLQEISDAVKKVLS